MHGGTEIFMERHMTAQEGSKSPKIGAYHGPISSITKHYFMVSQPWQDCLVVVGAVAGHSVTARMPTTGRTGLLLQHTVLMQANQHCPLYLMKHDFSCCLGAFLLMPLNAAVARGQNGQLLL
jgi:hypothetical protein